MVIDCKHFHSSSNDRLRNAHVFITTQRYCVNLPTLYCYASRKYIERNHTLNQWAFCSICSLGQEIELGEISPAHFLVSSESVPYSHWVGWKFLVRNKLRPSFLLSKWNTVLLSLPRKPIFNDADVTLLLISQKLYEYVSCDSWLVRDFGEREWGFVNLRSGWFFLVFCIVIFLVISITRIEFCDHKFG